MIEVTFITDYGFAENGISTNHFKAGETRLVSTSCADSAVQAGAARIGKGVASAPKNNAVTPPAKQLAAPKNKDAKPKQPKSKAVAQPK